MLFRKDVLARFISGRVVDEGDEEEGAEKKGSKSDIHSDWEGLDDRVERSRAW